MARSATALPPPALRNDCCRRRGVCTDAPGRAGPRRAAPEDIQGLHGRPDDLSAPGQLGVDVHNNFVVSGRSSPTTLASNRQPKVYRPTPEFAGIGKDFARFDLNAGVGRGLTGAADNWLVKFIVGINC